MLPNFFGFFLTINYNFIFFKEIKKNNLFENWLGFEGDDLEAVCKAAEERWNTPVVPVDCAGFYGTKNLGNRIAGESMVKYVCGTREPDPLPDNVRSDIKIPDVKSI